MTAGRLSGRCAVFMMAEAIGGLLRCWEHRYRQAPGNLIIGLPELCAMKGGKVGKVPVGDRRLAAPGCGISRVLCEEMGLCREGFGDQSDTFGRPDVAYLSGNGAKFFQRVTEDRHGHMVVAKAEAFRFEIVERVGEFGCGFALCRDGGDFFPTVAFQQAGGGQEVDRVRMWGIWRCGQAQV